jgi:hypothetical protein
LPLRQLCARRRRRAPDAARARIGGAARRGRHTRSAGLLPCGCAGISGGVRFAFA